MRKKHVIITAIIFVLVIIGTAAVARVVGQVKSFTESIKIEKQMDDLFMETICKGVDLNSGITIQKSGPIFEIQDPSQSWKIMAFLVFNHSSEIIEFLDRGFNHRIFWPDTDLGVWKDVEMTVHWLPASTLLPPRLEKYDPKIDNQFPILESDFVSTNYSIVRVYISGIGLTSGKVYGAYVDVYLNP